LRIGAIVGRKPSTKWIQKEKVQLAKAFPNPISAMEEQITLVEWFYALPSEAFPAGRDGRFEDYRRRQLYTLLNNWPGEVDKAGRFLQEHPRAGMVPKQETPVTSELLMAFLSLPESAGYRRLTPMPQNREQMAPSMRGDWDKWIRTQV
jgi:hypothetical protein